MFGKLKINRLIALAIAMSAFFLISCTMMNVSQSPENINLEEGSTESLTATVHQREMPQENVQVTFSASTIYSQERALCGSYACMSVSYLIKYGDSP